MFVFYIIIASCVRCLKQKFVYNSLDGDVLLFVIRQHVFIGLCIIVNAIISNVFSDD